MLQALSPEIISSLPAETKRCLKCKKTFLISTNFRSRHKSETTKMCSLCRNRVIKYNDKPTSARKKRREIYLSLKKNQIEKTRGCEWPDGCRFNFSDKPEIFAVCEEVQNIVIFEFDHITPQEKSFKMSEWVNHHKKTEQDLIDEISKCRILCSFHHHLHSQNQQTEKKKNKSDYSETIGVVQNRKRKRENYDKLTELKLDPERFGKCEMCKRGVLPGEISGFDFDHKNPTEKHHGISKLASRGFSWEKTILPEIDKCRLLCTNCHRLHTQKQQMQSNSKNEKSIFINSIVSRKRKQYQLPRNKEELEIRDKGERPTREELYALVLKYSFKNVGKIYGVYDTTIVCWCKKSGIPHKRRKLMDILNEI